MEIRKMYETHKLISRVCIGVILLAIVIAILSINVFINIRTIKNLQLQINEIRFEQEYIDYVKEDGERQINK